MEENNRKIQEAQRKLVGIPSRALRAPPFILYPPLYRIAPFKDFDRTPPFKGQKVMFFLTIFAIITNA